MLQGYESHYVNYIKISTRAKKRRILKLEGDKIASVLEIGKSAVEEENCENERCKKKKKEELLLKTFK